MKFKLPKYWNESIAGEKGKRVLPSFPLNNITNKQIFKKISLEMADQLLVSLKFLETLFKQSRLMI